MHSSFLSCPVTSLDLKAGKEVDSGLILGTTSPNYAAGPVVQWEIVVKFNAGAGGQEENKRGKPLRLCSSVNWLC